MDLWKCFFAMYSISYVKTPLFLTNSLIDAWQVPNVLGVACTPAVGGPGKCTEAELQAIQHWGDETMPSALAPALARAG